MKKINLIAAFLCVALIVVAQESKLSNYSRAFIDAQNEAKTTEQRNTLRKNFSLKVAESGQEYVSAFVHFADADADKSVLENYSAVLENDFGEFVTARIPVENLEALSQDEAVKLVEIGTPVRKKMDKARAAANVDKVQAGTNLSQPFLGTGVIVGVVDAGFQYNHINFYDANNASELRVKRVLRQANSSRASGYKTKKEYTTQSAIESAQYDDTSDEDGHATHVTGIAAGSYSGNNYYGIAKDADIVMVSYGTGNTDVANGIKYVFDYATEVGKPAVVNISLGTHIGPHDGTSTFDRTLDAMVGAGRIVCGAAGNEGEYPLYIEQTLTANTTTTEALKLKHTYSYGQSYYLPEIDIWGEANKNYSIQVVITKNGSDVWTSDTFAANTEKSKSYSSFTGASGGLEIYSGKNSVNNKGNVSIYYDSSNGFTLKSGYTLNVRFIGTDNCTVQAWADGYESIWVNGSTAYSVGEIGGTANRIISVGAWTTLKNSYNSTSKLNGICDFSSKGPTADGRLKPEITAPGDIIKSSIPNLSSVTEYSEGKTSKTINGTTYYWGWMSGTSMATPFVTGVVATWLQANPNLTPEQIKNVFAKTAQTDSYTGTSVPNNTCGYGKIDAYAGIVEVLQSTPVKNLEGLPEAIMLYPNPSDGAFTLFFTQNDENVDVRIYALNGQQIYTRHLGSVDTQQTLDINLGDVQTGAYIVKIAGDKTTQAMRLLVR